MSKEYQTDRNKSQVYAIEMLEAVRRNQAETRRHLVFYARLGRREGLTFEQIGNALGMTKSGVQKMLVREAEVA